MPILALPRACSPVMGGKLKMAGAPRTPAAHERETVVSSIPPNEHRHVTFPPAAAQQMQMSPQDPHAICLCATVLRYINRRFNPTAVAFLHHSTLQIKVNHLTRQKLGRTQICCRGLCSMRGFIAVTTVNFPIFLLAQTFGLKTFH